MSNTSFKIYSITTLKGLLSRLAASFKEDFRKFKKAFRTQYLPARQMLDIRRIHKGEELEGFFR